MARWLKGYDGEKILLSGVLSKVVFDKQETNFLIKLATDDDDGLIQNIAVGVAVRNVPARRVTCFHRTIPHTNYTAFYRRLSSKQIMLIGSGNHEGRGNKKYSVLWADGSNSTIDLDKTSNGAEFLPTPKRLNEEGRAV